MEYVVIYVHFPICCTLNNCTINIAGLGLRFRFGHGFLYYAGLHIGSDSDFDPLIEMYVIGMDIWIFGTRSHD